MENILLSKLKNLYIQYASISIMKKQNINQNVRVKKMVVFVKRFNHYIHKFSFNTFSAVQQNCKIIWNLDRNLIIALLTMANYRRLFEKHITADNQFLFQNIQNTEILEIFKMFKKNRWINVYYTKSKRL